MKSIALQILGCALLCHSSDGKTSGSSESALCMEGGGWRAQSAYTALFSGMLAHMNKEEHGVSHRVSSSLGRRRATTAAPSTVSLASSGLLDGFDIFSSNSGGSWFWSSMAYSDTYPGLVEGMAANPATSGNYMNDHWTTPVLKAMHVDPPTFNVKANLAKSLVDKYLGVGAGDTIFMLAYFLTTNATWNYFTDVHMGAGSNIGQAVLMGDPVNSWAQNKVWCACHSVLLPKKDNPASLYLSSNRSLEGSVSYYAETGNGGVVPTNVPAMFSIRMGAGMESKAPLRYAANMMASLQYTYNGVDLQGRSYKSVSKILSSDDFTKRFMTDATTEMPVLSAVSASSAAAGVAPILGPFVDEALAFLEADFTPWFTNMGVSDSLYMGTTLVDGLRGDDGVTQSSLDVLGASQLHGIVDGAFTDNLGLANAIAAGADEAVMLSNCGESNLSLGDMEYLFQGSKACTNPGCFAPPIFAESKSFAQYAYDGFQRLDVGNTTFLTALGVGSFTATTVDNIYYDIEAGRRITVNVIQLCGDLTIAFLQDIMDYNVFSQEIILALAAEQNSEIVQSKILPLFLASKVEVI